MLYKEWIGKGNQARDESNGKNKNLKKETGPELGRADGCFSSQASKTGE